MEFIRSAIPEVILIKPKVNSDERGFFLESYKKSEFIANGIKDEFIQDNHSKSVFGVLRGLHYQLQPKAQAKLVKCIKGKIFDVAVDIRKNSPSYGKWIGYELSEENKFMLYIPVGFAHGFLTLSPECELMYKTAGEYSKEHDRGILFRDPNVGIVWPNINSDFVLSEKDKKQPLLKDADNNLDVVQ